MFWDVGEIMEITRYPVKSFAGESVDACRVDTYGLYGDRFCAFYDETKEGWDRYVTARDIPDMLAYTAKLVDDNICVTSPAGRAFGWNEELSEEMQGYARNKITMSTYKAPHPEDPALMAVDQASILIISDVSLRKLESLWGKRLDKRRFRANLTVALDHDTFSELDWIGKRLVVGDAELQIHTRCQRCSMITIDPDTQERDLSLLKRVHEEMDLCFGVYASVKKTGLVQVGQRVYLA